MHIKSERAMRLLENPRFVKSEQGPGMKKYPGVEFNLWVDLEWEGHAVKNLSFFGELQDYQKVILESMASLLVGKPILKLDDLSFRECEAFLRDRNSVMALEGIRDADESEFKKIFRWIRSWPKYAPANEYTFSSEKGPFGQLKLVEKINELKAFLNSPEILALYEGVSRPELVDVDDFTAYIQAPYETERDRERFEELHLLGVETFREENLNFIPDA